MRQFVFPAKFGKRDNLRTLQICKALVITVGKCASDNFFHNVCGLLLFKFFERIVISGTIRKCDIYGHISLAYQFIVVKRPADTPVAVKKRMDTLKGEVEASNARYNVLVFRSMIGGKHVRNEPLNIFGSRADMCAYAYPFVTSTETARDVVANICNEHLVEEKHNWQRQFRFFCF